MGTKRTLGWVQNPNLLPTLKQVVGSITPGSHFLLELKSQKLPLLLQNGLISQEDYNEFITILSHSDISVKYEKLKGKGGKRGIGNNGKPNSMCTGIVQAAITAQRDITIQNLSGQQETIKKPYSDDWTADGYIRWAISTGLFEYNEKTDTVCVSDIGKQLVFSTDNSAQEKSCFEVALLAYPPVIRILTLLNDENSHTKFELGRMLGFEGEMGFTSIPQNMFVAEVCTAGSNKEASQIRQNEEGDSDKYARTIANWLTQMEWVKKTKKTVHERYCGTDYALELTAYQITPKGKRALKHAFGYSSNPRVPRIVYFEMLASKAPDAEYLRYRRAILLEYLGTKKWVKLDVLQSILIKRNINVSLETIKDDMVGLQRIGVDILFNGDLVMLRDIVLKLVIPQERFETLEVSQIKDTVRGKLKHLDHKYLSLIDLAYSDASTKAKKNADAREFEIETASLFTDELSFSGMRLGDSGRPDVIIYHNINGTIIDNKSYKNGFNVDAHCADEMMRYVMQNKNRHPGEPSNEWWTNFDSNVTNYTFLFITSFLKGKFDTNLRSINAMTGINGGAVAIDNLLYIAEDIKAGKRTKEDFFAMMNNCELVA